MNAGGVDKACKSNASVRGTDMRMVADDTQMVADINLKISAFISVESAFISVPVLCAGEWRTS
jgi:hypothetical protein